MDNEKKDKIIMIVNGQPIEMCPKTLNMCNKRAQRMVTSLKTQSLEKVHTMRLFWGDVVMLNIITNQLLQKVDSRSLARVLKPTNSLEEDLEEYRETRKSKVEKLKDTLIIANDSTLPLDYSRELEKYFYDTTPDEDEEESVIEKVEVPETKTVEKEEPEEKKKTQNNMQKRDKKIVAPVQKSSSTRNKSIYRPDDSEEEIDFSVFSQPQKNLDPAPSSKITPMKEKPKNTPQKALNKPKIEPQESTANITEETSGECDITSLFETKKTTDIVEEKEIKETQPIQPIKNEFERHQESFTSFGALDLDSLFG